MGENGRGVRNVGDRYMLVAACRLKSVIVLRWLPCGALRHRIG